MDIDAKVAVADKLVVVVDIDLSRHSSDILVVDSDTPLAVAVVVLAFDEHFSQLWELVFQVMSPIVAE